MNKGRSELNVLLVDSSSSSITTDWAKYYAKKIREPFIRCRINGIRHYPQGSFQLLGILFMSFETTFSIYFVNNWFY